MPVGQAREVVWTVRIKRSADTRIMLLARGRTRSQIGREALALWIAAEEAKR